MSWSTEFIYVAIGAYLLGSIPTSVWFGKIFFNIDLREYGSGNAGATNALRVFGNRAGIIVLLLDALKGYLAVSLLVYLPNEVIYAENQWIMVRLSLGILALLGHVFPVFANFRGGKGIATLAGVFVAVAPWAVLISLGVFLLVFIPSKYVSLGSVSAAFLFPFVNIFLLNNKLLPEVIFSSIVAVFVIYTHRTNIRRLINGEENKLKFGKKGIANQ